MPIEPLKKYWICHKEGKPAQFHSISCNKKYSIKKFIEGSMHPWEYWRKIYGWKCIKVNIEFKEL